MKGWEMLFRVVLKQFDINGRYMLYVIICPVILTSEARLVSSVLTFTCHLLNLHCVFKNC